MQDPVPKAILQVDPLVWGPQINRGCTTLYATDLRLLIPGVVHFACVTLTFVSISAFNKLCGFSILLYSLLFFLTPNYYFEVLALDN